MQRLASPLRLLTLALLLTSLVGCAADDADADDHGDIDMLSEAFDQSLEDRLDPGKVDSPGCNGVLVPDRSGFQNRIALTFDDGPDATNTPAIMAVLRRQNVPAAFFVNGNRVTSARTEQVMRDIAADPLFILASHTWSHPASPYLDQLSSRAMAAQIDDNDAEIRQAGGTPRYFRFPFGRATCTTANLVRDRGHIITGWNVDSADWCYNASSSRTCTWRGVPSQYRNDMRGYVLSQLRSTRGGIVLFHSIHRYTAEQIEGIIIAARAAGFTFTSLSDTATFPLLNGSAPEMARFVGQACERDAQCAFATGGFCHEAGFCSIPCNNLCPDRPGLARTFCIADDAATTPRGICVSRSATENHMCADVPGTVPESRMRYGTSGTTAVSQTVCAPVMQ